MSAAAGPVMVVVQQHAEEVAALRHVRSVLVRAPHVALHRLARLDERLAAHLDGLHVAGEPGLACLRQALSMPTVGAVFALAVVALQSRDAVTLSQLVALAASLPEARRGLLSAMGWVSAEDLQGTVRALLGSKVATHRAWALLACAMHKVDPGPYLTQAVQDADEAVRAQAWLVAGRMGRMDLAEAARQAVLPRAAAQHDEQATLLLAPAADSPSGSIWTSRRAAAWALTLWGEGQNELVRAALAAAGPDRGLPPQDAHRLAVMAAPLGWAREQVRAMSAQAERNPIMKRRMMRMVAWVGDPQVVPWLLHHMVDDKWARLAGECFTLITGLDLVVEGLERPSGEPVPPTGPTDNPDDADVAMDEDDNLPWPDQVRVQAWWQAHGGRYAQGHRHFMGSQPDTAHVLGVLRQGGQRQRIMAAEYLCLLQPGQGLFPVAAPAWRQSRWLAPLAQTPETA